VFQSPATEPLDLQAFKSTISLPYRLTPGKAMGSFIAELSGQRIVGSRCRTCNRVEVPAQDFCQCGSDDHELVIVPSKGKLTGFTETPHFTLGTVRLEGADCDLMHHLCGEIEWVIGQSVEVVWSDKVESTMRDMLGFKACIDTELQVIQALTDPKQFLDSMPTSLTLDYHHAQGPYYGRLFDEMQSAGRKMGIRCSHCQIVHLPPREMCDICYEKTGTWVDVADTGVLQAFSIIHLKFVGQFREPPYVYAEVMLDGASTKIIHVLEVSNIERAHEFLKPGMRVQAVWRKELKGSLGDIEYFKLLEIPSF
jgi:uncharacterized OB-fold protein